MLGHFTYSIRRQRLSGSIDGKTFDLAAVSGFGRGWQQGKDEPPGFPGRQSGGRGDQALGQAALNYIAKPNWGPIPPGFYKIRRPEANGLKARIESHLSPRPFSRHDFEIHGRAKHEYHGQFHVHASHGCIVPEHDGDLQRLMKALSDAVPGHDYVATLEVTE